VSKSRCSDGGNFGFLLVFLFFSAIRLPIIFPPEAGKSRRGVGSRPGPAGFYFLEAEVVLDKGEKFLLDKTPPVWFCRVG
jgi:hypothetical protein